MFPSSYSLSSKPPPPKYSDFSGYGWVIVTCSFLLYLIVDGIAYNLGLINSAWLAEFQQSETATSWIGSIFYSVPLLSAPITAQLVENFGCKTITIVCSIISTFGFVMSSFCGSIEQLYLTVGLIAGFGVSAAYIVGILSAERWFDKNRTLAIGIVSSGTGFGTFVIAPITQRLLDAYGWRNTMYFLASLNVLMGFVGFYIREPQWIIDEMEKKSGKVISRAESGQNHGLFDEHETSFGTFRRLSLEAIDDLKDVVRGHFNDAYSHLEEVVEEKEQNFYGSGDISENFSENATEKIQKSEVMYENLEPNEISEVKSDLSSEIQKSEVMYENLRLTQKSEVMSNLSQNIPQMNIKCLQINSSRHKSDDLNQLSNVNESQERSKLENNVNIIENETNTSTSAYNLRNCHEEVENENTKVHVPHKGEKCYQQEVLGSNGDCETLTPIIFARNIRAKSLNFGSYQNVNNIDAEVKLGAKSLQNGLQNLKKDQVFTISNEHLEGYPKISKSDQHNIKNDQMCHNNHYYPKNIKKVIDESYQQQNPPPYPHIYPQLQNFDTKSNQQIHDCISFNKLTRISSIILKFIKEKFKMAKSGLKTIFSHFSNRNFTLLAISTFAIYALYNIPIYFIVELLKTYGYTEPQCANYISLIGISLLIGMVSLGYIGDISGDQVKNVNALCVLVCGISEILFPNCASNSTAFGICCVFFGFSFASAYVLIPKIAEMIVGVEEFATAIGLNFFVQGLALLFGIPFASTIYEAIGSWKIAFEICGTIISFGSIFAYLVNVKRE